MGNEATKSRHRWRVNMQEDDNRRYWSRRFGCTEEELGTAVTAVGDSGTAVMKWLRAMGKITL